MQSFQAREGEIHYETMGRNDGPVFIWAHGWGQNHQSFKALAQTFEQGGRHILVDFPGFGASPPPKTVWGTADYADAMAEFLKAHNFGKVIWIGHSFGCRVGLQIAARHPELVKGMGLIAAAGLKRKRPFHKKLYLKFRIALFKFLKKCIPLGVSEKWLKKKFGAADYRNASGTMRGVIVNVVNEDLTPVAASVKCPVLLIYGTRDTETPLEIGQRLNALIAGSALIPMEGLDHYTVLTSGRHQVAPHLKKFIEALHA